MGFPFNDSILDLVKLFKVPGERRQIRCFCGRLSSVAPFPFHNLLMSVTALNYSVEKAIQIGPTFSELKWSKFLSFSLTATHSYYLSFIRNTRPLK